MKVYAYDGCSTCRKALAYLKSTGRQFQLIPIRETPPTKAELRQMLKFYGGKVKHLFNVSGQDYRALGLGAKLPKLSDEQAIDLLSRNGNLVKRPFVLVGNTGIVGFKEDEWLDKGLRQLPKGL
jgi:arsenate reductase